jgi:SAM-dependent methyltransferase
MKEIWQKIHSDYSKKDWVNKPSIFAEQVLKYFPKDGSLIELGGALGQDSLFFVSKGYDVLLTDLSSEVLKEGQMSGLRTKQVDIGKPLPFPDNSFDVVYAHLSLHYFDRLVTHKVFDEISRILKSEGILAALFNSTTDPEYGTGTRIENNFFEINSIKKRFFSVDAIKEFVEDYDVLLLDDSGETYKDNAKGVKNLVRFVGRKIIKH